jgi:hypothetical protein
MFNQQIGKTFNSKRPDFRKVEHEKIEEFLARGGTIKKISLPSRSDVLGERVKQELYEE